MTGKVFRWFEFPGALYQRHICVDKRAHLRVENIVLEDGNVSGPTWTIVPCDGSCELPTVEVLNEMAKEVVAFLQDSKPQRNMNNTKRRLKDFLQEVTTPPLAKV